MKKFFIKYPTIVFSVLFIASLYLLLLSPLIIKIAIWAFAVLSFLVLFLVKIKIKPCRFTLIIKYALLICAVLIFSVIVQLLRYDIPMTNAKQHIDKQEAVTAYVKEVYYSLDYMSAAKCVITEIDGEKCNIPVYAKFDSRLGLEEYDYFKTTFLFSDISNATDDYNTKYSFIASDIRLLAVTDELAVPTGENHIGIVPFFANINQSICNQINKTLNKESAGLVNALLFGDKTGLTPEVKRDFNTLGITHLLVVSGMNIAIIAGMFEMILLHVFKMKRWIRSIICSAISIIYMALCGFSLTVIRAALMQIFCRVSINAKAGYHSLTSLFASVLLISAIFPGAIYDIGLILSFLATLGIVSFGQYTESSIKKIPKFARSTAASIFTSLAACIFILPISYYVFGNFSMFSPVATLIFGLILDVILHITPLFLITSFIPIVGRGIGYIIEFICNAVLQLTSYAYLFKDFYVSFNYKGIEILIILLVFCVILGYLLKTKRKLLKVIPAFTVFFAICLTSYINSDIDGIYYYTATNNDAVIFNYSKDNAIIDISTGSKNFASSAVSLQQSQFNVSSPDSYILTHYHSRHVTTIDYLVSNTHIKKIFLPSPVKEEEKEIYEQIRLLTEEHRVQTEVYQNSFNSGEVKFIKFENTYIERSVHPIISFKLVYNEKSICYLGSAAFESENFHTGETDDLVKSPFIIFGSHGPLIKNSIPDSCFNSSSKVYFSNDEIYSFCNFAFNEYYIGSQRIYTQN